MAGYHTIVEDILPASLRRAEGEIRAGLEDAIGRGTLTAADATAIFSRVEFGHSVEEAARAADLVIECVPDEMESKLEIFVLLDKICRPGVILVANTSTISVTELAGVTYRAAQCVGMRFQQPVREMKSLVVVPGQFTDRITLAAAQEMGRRMGLAVAIATDLPVSAGAT
jgi:3-hydroxyacyl-CoA dehydrogenase